MGEIRIAVVDDSPPFLAAAADYIARLPGCVVVENAEEADLLRLDLGPTPARGLDLVRRVRSRPGARGGAPLPLSHTPDAAAAARRAGACALIGKEAFVSGLAEILAALFPAIAA